MGSGHRPEQNEIVGEDQLRKSPAFPNRKILKILHMNVRVLSSILLAFLNLQNIESVGFVLHHSELLSLALCGGGKGLQS